MDGTVPVAKHNIVQKQHDIRKPSRFTVYAHEFA